MKRKARKVYICNWCKYKILVNTIYHYFHGKPPYHYHLDCWEQDKQFADDLVKSGKYVEQMDYPTRI